MESCTETSKFDPFNLLTIWACTINAGSGMGAAAVFERGDCVDELRNT